MNDDLKIKYWKNIIGIKFKYCKKFVSPLEKEDRLNDIIDFIINDESLNEDEISLLIEIIRELKEFN